MKKRIYLIIFLLGQFFITTHAQTTKTVGTGGDYATLTSAFTAINSGTLTGDIVLQIVSSTTEPAVSGRGAQLYGKGEVGWVRITAGGTGYKAGDPVTFSTPGAGGTSAEGVIARVDGGAILYVYITNPGIGYTSAPTITFGGTGSGATGVAEIGGNYNSVLIYPTVSGATINANADLFTVDLLGADNVTIDGRVNQSGSADMTIVNTAINPSVFSPYYYSSRMGAVRFQNDATNNVLKYLVLKSNVYDQYSPAGNTNGINYPIVLFGRSLSLGNSDNTLEACKLTKYSNVPIGILSDAFPPMQGDPSYGDLFAYTEGASNSRNTIKNNEIYDLLKINYRGILLNSKSENWTIEGNSFYQTSPVTMVATNPNNAAILLIAGKHVISNNYIGGSAPQNGSVPWQQTGQRLTGILVNAPAEAGNSTIQGNTISNIQSIGNTTTTIEGITLSGTAKATIENNVVSAISTAGSGYQTIRGIYLGGQFVNQQVINNRIFNLQGTGPGTGLGIIGIYAGAAGYNNGDEISRNHIHSFLSNSHTNVSFGGINFGGGPGAGGMATNNIITLTTDVPADIAGISGNINKAYYNTVYIGGSPTSGANNSFALNNSLYINNVIDMRNNILVNARSNAGAASGKHYAIGINGRPKVIDYNNYYAPGTGGIIGIKTGGNDNLTLDAWRTITKQDCHSLTIDPAFSSAGGTNVADYLPSAIGLKGTPITGITTDYGNITRNSVDPAMGAYDYAVINQIPTPSITSFSPGSGGEGTVVTITGANLDGTNKVYFNGKAAASVTVINATQVTATVPINAFTGKISVVSNCDSLVSATDFIIVELVGNVRPILEGTSITTECEATTVDLTTVTDLRVANNTVPSGAVLTWHTASPATNENRVLDPTKAPVEASYYAAYYYSSGPSYGKTSVEQVMITKICAFTVENTCPSTTVTMADLDLDGAFWDFANPFIFNSPPVTPLGQYLFDSFMEGKLDGPSELGATLHTSAEATEDNMVLYEDESGDPYSLPAGTYYLALWNGVTTTKTIPLVIKINSCNSLPEFSYCPGTASEVKTYRFVTNDFFMSQIDISAPTGFEIRITGTPTFGSSVSVPSKGNIPNDVSLDVRVAASAPAGPLAGNIEVEYGEGDGFLVSVSAAEGCSPSDGLKITSVMTAFNHCPSAPSDVQTISVSGTGLTANILITAPTGFEIRKTGDVTFASTVTLTETAGSVAATSIDIRVAAGATAAVSGNVSVTSGSFTETLAVSGTPLAVNTAGTASVSPTLLVNTDLTDITHTTTGATGIGTATGLPAGVAAAWAANTITISGTPSATGTFAYTIPLTGGCGTVNATGTITVTACTNPTSGGTIVASKTTVTNTETFSFSSTAAPAGHSGTLEYKWQQSTTSSSSDFDDIDNSNSATLNAGPISVTTWYKRLARVDCKNDWTGAAASNVVQVTVQTGGGGGCDGADLNEFNNTQKLATGISLNEEISANLPAASDQDWYKFTVPTAGTYTIYFTPNGATEVTFVKGSASNGVVSFNGVGQAKRITVMTVTLKKGTALIKISDSQLQSKLCYTLRVVSSAPQNAPTSPEARESFELEPDSEPLSLQVELYPNPVVTNTVSVRIEGAAQKHVRLQLMDLKGQVVLQRDLKPETRQHTEELDVTNLPAGMLLLRLSTDREQVVKKLLKQ
jgi:hypothetical protein